MFTGPDEIGPIIKLLEQRGVSLWHACQLRDLGSYMAVGGIPSRSLLEQAGLAFTGFDTDATDRSGGMWSKVFVNLSDFGASFARGLDAVPNPYGPIAIQIRPTALLRSQDVAICLRSAGAHDFDRDGDSLTSTADIERLFRYSASAPFPLASFQLYGEHLKERFAPRFPYATAAEVSVSIEPELIPWDDVLVVWVDPIVTDEVGLVEDVVPTVDASHRRVPVHERSINEDRRIVLGDIVRYLSQRTGPPSLRFLAGHSDVAQETRDWALAVLGRDLDWQFKRYAKYLAAGTLANVGVGLGRLDAKLRGDAVTWDEVTDRQAPLRRV